MAESGAEFAERVIAAQAVHGRLPIPQDAFTTWETFPFEGDLRVRELSLGGDEAPRHGEDPADCWCAPGADKAHDWPVVWSDANWHVKVAPASGSPLVLVLEPNAHVDLPDLDDELAAGLGLLTASLVRAVEQLPSVGRCHVGRWGDGGAHGHVWFIARPSGMPQLRGTFMALWDDLLPAVPAHVQAENVRFVVDRLVAERGGTRTDGDL
jgi:hypothetical protein